MRRPRVDGINHLNLRVMNLEKSSNFYKQVLGMKEAFREPPRAIFLKCGEDLLTLARTRRRRPTGGMHFGFHAKSKEEFYRWRSWLSKSKVRVTSVRKEESGGGMYFRDPDGYLIEVYYEKL